VALDDYRGAIYDCTKVIELEPNNSEAYEIRGFSKISIGQKESGCLDLSRSGELGNYKAYDTIKKFCN